MNSPYFKDLYLYLSQNKLPSSKSAIHKTEALAEKYILLDSLLFKLNLEKEKVVLTIPEVCVDQIITLYHSSLFAGHQGVVKTYLTMAVKFFFLTSCIICTTTSKVATYANFQRKIRSLIDIFRKGSI